MPSTKKSVQSFEPVAFKEFRFVSDRVGPNLPPAAFFARVNELGADGWKIISVTPMDDNIQTGLYIVVSLVR